MKLDELDVFQMYLAVKHHFTSEYDFFRYKGRLNSKACSYENLVSKPYYNAIRKLSRTYEAKQLCEYFVSNMLINEGAYLYDVEAEGKRIYHDFIRRKESRTYIFKQDINRVCMELEKKQQSNFWNSVEVHDGQHPLLFRMFVGSYLAPETMCLLYKINDYLTEWDAKVSDTIFYPVVSRQIRKLSPFIMIKDLDPYVSLVSDVNMNYFN